MKFSDFSNQIIRNMKERKNFAQKIFSETIGHWSQLYGTPIIHRVTIKDHILYQLF